MNSTYNETMDYAEERHAELAREAAQQQLLGLLVSALEHQASAQGVLGLGRWLVPLGKGLLADLQSLADEGSGALAVTYIHSEAPELDQGRREHRVLFPQIVSAEVHGLIERGSRLLQASLIAQDPSALDQCSSHRPLLVR